MESPISFMDPQVQRCPFPSYEAVRKDGPVYRDPLTGWFVVTSYDEARKLTGDTVNLSNDTGFLFNRQSQDEHHQERVDRIWQEKGFPRVPALVVVDPPDHTFHRSFINKSFTPYRVRLMEDYLESVVDGMIDDFIDADEVDFKSELAIKVPLAVIADQLGMPRSDLDKLHFWSDSILEHLDPTITDEREIELTEVICELHRYAAAKVEEYRASPKECLLSDFANATVEGRRLTMSEIAVMVTQVLSGGNDSTANGLANGLMRLIEQPELQDRLRERPQLVPAFVEEVLRLDAPVQGLFRRVVKDLRIGDTEIPEGSIVILKWGAANRDPERFPEPDELDLERANSQRHLTFGYGPHMCVGAGLTRGEMRVTFTRLLARVQNIRLARGPEGAVREPHFFSYGFREMWIAFDPV
ncbi:MAG TPA: cytochrome P450 [Pseudonocardia sp.]|nr:cytochrome P450 [Pseudonocardia sp.]